MVRYLGISYLNEAVASRRQLLSRCLLTVPHHPEQPDGVTVIDDRYRLPWTKVEAEKEFLKNEAGKVVAAADELLQLTEVASQKIENFSLDPCTNLDCPVVPSSNPDSPDFFPEDHTFPTTLTTPDIIIDSFEQEDLKQYQTVNGVLHLDILSQEDYLSDTLKKLPSVSTLQGRFRPVQVKDPLAQDKNFGKADLRFSCEDEAVPMLEQKYNCELFEENFKSQFPACQKIVMMEGELEAVITPPCSQALADGTEEMARLSRTVISREEMPIETEASVTEIVETSLCVQQDKTKPEPLGCSPVVSQIPSFLDINEIIITEEDLFCERAFLPVPDDDSIERELKIPKLQIPKVENITVADTSTNICLLTEKEKQILKEKTFASERFCDEIQASRLPEPAIDVEEAFSKDESLKDNPVNKAKEVLDNTPCADIGQTELSLPWGIIKFGSEVKDTSKMLNKLTVEGAYSITVKPVETVEKYNNADIYDWKDPMICLKEPPTYKKAMEIGQTENITETKPQGYKDIVTKSVVARAPVILPTVGNDPLDDFMALRMNLFSASNRQPAVTVETEKANPEPYPGPEVNIQPSSVKDLRPAQQGRKRTKHHVVSVRLSDDFRQVLELLSDKANYMIQALKLTGDVSQSCSFESLTPDMTRFLLKQKEKQIQDGNSDADETYRNIVGLHALSGATDIIANCCLESGIAHISAVQEKYGSTLKGLLTDVRQKLFEMKARFYKRQVHHPKIVTLCKEVETWLKKKRAKSGDNEHKILVLIKRDLPSLLKSLKTVLSQGQLLVPEVITSFSSEDIIKSLDQHNCLLAFSGLVDDNFPWAQFCLVVEYENQSDTVWKDHCERQNIRHIALTLDKGDPQEATSDSSWTTANPSQQITVIASQNITKNIELLQILETRHNILLVERDYSLIEGCRQLHFPDVDVDEGCGIVLAPLVDLKDDCMVQALVAKILALSLKLVSCWILLYSDKPNCYEFPGVVVTSLSRLEAVIANMSFKKEQLEVKVLTCLDLSEVAGCIRSISEHCMTANKARDTEDWLAREWLSEVVSQGEKFLLMMPPITSFTAQLMLKFFSLKELLSCDLLELTAILPYVPEKVLMLLLRVANNVYGLHLQENKPTCGAEQENLEEFSVDLDDDTEEESHCLSTKESSDIAENTNTSPNEARKVSKSNVESDGDYHKPTRQNQGVLPYTDYNSAGNSILDSDESRMSEDGDHNSAEKNAILQAGEDNRRTADRKLDDMHHFNLNRTAQAERNSGATAMSNCNTNRECQNLLALENFIKGKKHPANLENNNNLLQSCRDVDHINMVKKLTENNINRKIQADNIPEEKGKGRLVNELRVDIPQTGEQDVRYRNKQHVEGYQDNQRCMMKYQQNKLSKTAYVLDPSTNYPVYQRRQDNSYADETHHVRRSLNEDFNSEYESDGLNTKSMDNVINIDKFSADEIEKCVTEDLNRSKTSSDDTHQKNMGGFSPAEIERCLNEDLENYVNNRFANPKKMIQPDPTRQQLSVLNDTLRSMDNKLSDDTNDKVNFETEVFEKPIDERKWDSRFDQIMASSTVNLKHSFLPSTLSSKIVRKTDSEFQSFDNTALDAQLYNGSDCVNIRGSTSQLLNLNQNTKSNGRELVNRSRYFYNEDDILLGNSRALREMENEINFQQLLRRDVSDPFIGKNQQSENFIFRPVLDQFDQIHYQPNRFSGNGDNFERNDSSSKRFNLDLASLGNSSDTFYPAAAGINIQRQTRFDLEPSPGRCIPDETRMETLDTSVTKSIKTAEENRQLQQNSKQAVSEFMDNPGKFYVNPNIKRLSQPPKLVNTPSKVNTEVAKGGRTLADDLRETTRKVLANSQQFSSFTSTSSRRPMQKLNIGLAVPLHRDQRARNLSGNRSRNLSGHSGNTSNSSQPRNPVEELSRNHARPRTDARSRTNAEPWPRQQLESLDTKNMTRESDAIQHQRPAYESRHNSGRDISSDSDATQGQRSDYESMQRSQRRTLQEQKALMMQSPWTTDDSPPMDLDYDEEFTQRNISSTNRAVFTNQTPQKKRKLTYQAVPGKKGQTRLVFQ